MIIVEALLKNARDRAAQATGKARCRQCGKELTGRSDKRYCSGKCHDAFNNRVKAQRRQDEQAFLRPAQESDYFLAELFKVDPNKEWFPEVVAYKQRRNQNFILVVVGVAALAAVCFMVYDHWQEQRRENAV